MTRSKYHCHHVNWCAIYCTVIVKHCLLISNAPCCNISFQIILHVVDPVYCILYENKYIVYDRVRSTSILCNGKLFIKGKLQTQFLDPTLPDPEPASDDDDDTAPVQSTQVSDSAVFSRVSPSLPNHFLR